MASPTSTDAGSSNRAYLALSDRGEAPAAAAVRAPFQATMPPGAAAAAAKRASDAETRRRTGASQAGTKPFNAPRSFVLSTRVAGKTTLQEMLVKNEFASADNGKEKFDAVLADELAKNNGSWHEVGAELPSDRNRFRSAAEHVIHSMGALELACAEDKGKIYPSNARKAMEARKLQTYMIQRLLVSGAQLPYKVVDKNIFSVLRANNVLLWEKDTKMKTADHVRPRLVHAFANLDLAERDAIVERDFFCDPAHALYSYGCLIEAAAIVQQLHNPSRADITRLEALKEGLQLKLVQLFAFIDCPLDEDGDGALDETDVNLCPLIDCVLCSPNGWLALKQMAAADCQCFLGDDRLEPFFRRHYRGSLLTQLLVESHGERDDGAGKRTSYEFSWRMMLLRWLIFLWWTFVNIISAPVASVLLIVSGRTLWEDSRRKRLYTHWHPARSRSDGFDYGERGQSFNEPHTYGLKFGLQRYVPPAIYMLEEPWMTGMLRSIAELGQVLLLGSLRTISPDSLPFWIRVNCVWAIAMLVSETSELMHLGKIYFKDSLNWAKFCGLILTTFSLSARAPSCATPRLHQLTPRTPRPIASCSPIPHTHHCAISATVDACSPVPCPTPSRLRDLLGDTHGREPGTQHDGDGRAAPLVAGAPPALHHALHRPARLHRLRDVEGRRQVVYTPILSRHVVWRRLLRPLRRRGELGTRRGVWGPPHPRAALHGPLL